MSVTLDQARIISEAALAKARELGLKPISVIIMDPRTSLVACLSEDGVSQMRWRIAPVSYTHLTLPTILLV